MVGFDPRSADDCRLHHGLGGQPVGVGSARPRALAARERRRGSSWSTPIRTPTAEMADLHLQPFPGSDAALAFATPPRRSQRDRLAGHRLRPRTTRSDSRSSRPRLQPAHPVGPSEKTGVHCGADRGSGTRLWRGAVARCGLVRASSARHDGRQCDAQSAPCCPAVTGNIGKPGTGFLLPERARSAPDRRGLSLRGRIFARGHQARSATWTSRPALEDRDRAQALVCWNINIAASNPQQARLRRALEREDLLTVAIDLFETDTTDLADFVLPGGELPGVRRPGGLLLRPCPSRPRSRRSTTAWRFAPQSGDLPKVGGVLWASQTRSCLREIERSSLR